MKWKKSEAGGYYNLDIDKVIWCPCGFGFDDGKILELHTGDPGKSKTITCPGCGTMYRMVVRITLEEPMKQSTRDELRKERRRLIRELAGITRVVNLLTEEQLLPYERIVDRIHEINAKLGDGVKDKEQQEKLDGPRDS